MATLLLRNIGDIWDKSKKRVTEKASQNIINMAACRGISLFKAGQKVIFPRVEGLESYTRHVAEFLMPNASDEEQVAYMSSALIPVDLNTGDATSEDYIDSPTLMSESVRAFIADHTLDPYVDGERAKAFAETFGCHYETNFHELFSR